jgi:oxamate amidohydrolase
LLKTALNSGTMFTAPHRDAALVGKQVLEAGGTAMEAMVAAAAMIAVVYPHMNGIGGDGFWLLHRPGKLPAGIAACGQSAALASPEWYAERGYTDAMPTRGGLAALTVPGTIGGWAKALAMVERDNVLSVAELLAPAIERAPSRSDCH